MEKREILNSVLTMISKKNCGVNISFYEHIRQVLLTHRETIWIQGANLTSETSLGPDSASDNSELVSHYNEKAKLFNELMNNHIVAQESRELFKNYREASQQYSEYRCKDAYIKGIADGMYLLDMFLTEGLEAMEKKGSENKSDSVH